MASYRSLQWLFPVAVTLHNTEEAMWLPGFAVAHAAELPWHVDAGVFRGALVALTVAAWVVTYLSWRHGPQSMWAYFVFGSAVAMLVNVLVPHIPAALIFRGYAPGVVTAVSVNLPIMTILIVRAVREHWVSARKAVAFAVGVPVGLAALIVVVLVLGPSSSTH